MKSTEVGRKKSLYVVQVLEDKTILPSKIKEVIPKKYSFEGVEIELVGTVAKGTDGTYELTARASNQVYRVTENDELKKLVEAGTTKVLLSGKFTEEEKKEGDKIEKILLISAVSAKEPEEPKK